MVDYRDFMLQAQKDIKRAKWLYEKKDYGFSAYSVQQALEKSLKAYLMKIGITKNPDNFKHLTYPKLFEEIVSDLAEQKLDPRNDEAMNKFLDSFIEYFQNYSKIFNGFEKSEPKKILCWKESLGLELNDEEKKIAKGIETECNKIQNILLSSIIGIFPLQDQQTKSKLDSAGASKLLALIQRAMQALASNYNLNLEKELDEMQVIVHPYLYGMNEDSLSRKDSDFFLKFIDILRTFQWVEGIISTYPHEEIGRYPTNIDGKISLDIYKEQKEGLLNLINSVELTCQQIKTVITHG